MTIQAEYISFEIYRKKDKKTLAVLWRDIEDKPTTSYADCMTSEGTIMYNSETKKWIVTSIDHAGSTPETKKKDAQLALATAEKQYGRNGALKAQLGKAFQAILDEEEKQMMRVGVVDTEKVLVSLKKGKIY